MSLRVTEKAESKLKQYMAENPDFFPKVAVTSGGCSGFKYHIGLDKKQDTDHLITLASGFSVLVPEDSLPYLDGVTLDYKESLMNAGFSFDNPNAHGCGCGSSFRPKDSESCD